MILFGLLLSFCTGRKTKSLDETTVRNYEIQLDSLVQKTIRLNISEGPSKFIAIWGQARQILDLLPDSSENQKKARIFFIQQLSDIGGYEEAIRQRWQIITANKSDNNSNITAPGMMVYGALAGLYKKIGEEDSACLINQLAIASSNKYRTGKRTQTQQGIQET